MKLELEFYSAFCSTSIFKINNIIADSADFGEQYDRDTEGAEEYCCGDMQFTRIPSTIGILQKYNITEEEYFEIVEKLEEGLSFGCCGLCL